MPIIPYTPFPTEGPRPAPPEDYQRIQTNPRQFGAQVGAAEERLGAGATRAGEVFGQIASDDQANHVLEGLDDLNMRLRSLQGKDRMDQYPAIRQQMDDLVNQARGNLTTLNQQVDFDRQVRYLHSRALRESGDLYDQAQQQWGLAVNKGGANLSVLGISKGASAGDFDAVKNHEQDLINWRTKDAMLIYGHDLPPEIRNNVISGAKQESVSAQVRALEPTNPTLAKKILDDNRDVFAGTPAYDALSNSVKAHAFRSEVDGLVSGALGGGAAVPSGPVQPGEKGVVSPQQVAAAAQKVSFDPVTANVTASIESKHGADASNAISPSHQGVFQLGPDERVAAGGSRTSVGTLDEQVNQGIATLASVKADMTGKLGREPNGFEVWLGHNQGASGATKLINNPNTPAGQLVPPVNISNNGGDPSKPASEFLQHWQQIYNQKAQQFGGSPMEMRQAATDLGAQGGLMPSGPITPAYRSPGLTAALDHIASQDASPEAKELAAARVERRFNAQIADENRYEAALQKQRRDASDQYEQHVIADATSAKPTLTATDVGAEKLADGSPNPLTPDAKLRMIGFINRVDKPDPLSRVSQQTTSHLLEDMRRDPGDPARINDTAPIYDAFIHQQLSRADFDFLNKQFQDIRSPQGEKLAAREKELLSGIKPLITKSNPLMGSMDPIGDPNFYMYQWTVDQKVDQYRREGKDPFTLFDPKNPDYVGSADFVRPFQGTFQQSLKAKTGAITAPPAPPAYPAAAAPPAVVPRQPGETPADYMRRIGAAAAPIPPAATAPAPAPAPAVAPPIAQP